MAAVIERQTASLEEKYQIQERRKAERKLPTEKLIVLERLEATGWKIFTGINSKWSIYKQGEWEAVHDSLEEAIDDAVRYEARQAKGPTVFKEIPLNDIIASPFQLRKTFEDGALQELAESIKAKGVLEPILVRPKRSPLAKTDAQQVTVNTLGLDTQRYELVAGERRFRAAKLAGLPVIPAIVRSLTDKESAEIGAIENLQRQDLDPIEEAEGFRMLIDGHGYTADTLSEKLHKSKSYLYSALKLIDIPAKAKEALAAGEISVSIAQLIGRIPNPKLREEATKSVVSGWDGPLSFRRAKDWIERTCMKQLKGAVFSPEDAELLPAAGACSACPKLAGNNRELYPDGRADVCTEPGCFEKKVAAFHDKALDGYRKKGLTILSSGEVAKAFPYGDYLTHGSKYALLTETCYEDPSHRKYSALLGKEYKPIIAQTKSGAVFKLALRADAMKALDLEGVKVKNGQSSVSKSNPDLEIVERALVMTGGRIAEAVESSIDWSLTEVLRVSCETVIDSQGIDDVAKRRGLTFEGYQGDKALKALLPGMSQSELAGLLAEIVFHEYCHSYQSRPVGEVSQRLLDMFKINFLDVKLEAKRLIAEEKKAIAPAKKKKGK